MLVEMFFRQLKGRFPLLAGTMRLSPDVAAYMVYACVVVHNICKELGDAPLHAAS